MPPKKAPVKKPPPKKAGKKVAKECAKKPTATRKSTAKPSTRKCVTKVKPKAKLRGAAAVRQKPAAKAAARKRAAKKPSAKQPKKSAPKRAPAPAAPAKRNAPRKAPRREPSPLPDERPPLQVSVVPPRPRVEIMKKPDVPIAAAVATISVVEPPPPARSGQAVLLPRHGPPPITIASASPSVQPKLPRSSREEDFLVPLSPAQVARRGPNEDDLFLMSPLFAKKSSVLHTPSAERATPYRSRSSAQLISKAAAAKPEPCPSTIWISLSSDSDDDDVAPSAQTPSVMDTHPSPCPTTASTVATTASGGSIQGAARSAPPSLLTQPLPPSSVLMRDVLPPTFRVRKAAYPRLPPPPGALIHDVDAEDEAKVASQMTQQLPSPSVYHRALAQVRHAHHADSASRRSSAAPPWRNGAVVAQSPAAVDPPAAVAAETPSYFTPNKYSDERPVEVLRPLFPTSFTKERFLDMVPKVVAPEHCLQPNDFWDAFRSVEYLGEGSFGLVWKCVTMDGDEVAVKSCPISFQSPEAIDDGFSVLREVAVMRFLQDHKVPYILPLHNAFFVNATEALPPIVAEAVCAKSRVDEEMERRQRKQRRPRKDQVLQSTDKADIARDVLSSEERELIESTVLPKFMVISELDALECDATLFLVIELCDGDVEGIERSDAVSRGVAYCISSALAEIHKLGLVHLDLKPSNILYAYDKTSAINAAAAANPAAIKFYLSDFGNCHIVGPAYTEEVEDAVGTYEYMDTHALEHKICTRATDCFSLGCTLFELLTCSRLLGPCQVKRCGDNHSRSCYVKQSKGPFVVPGATILHRVTELLLSPHPLHRLTAAGCRSYLVNALGVTSHEMAHCPPVTRPPVVAQTPLSIAPAPDTADSSERKDPPPTFATATTVSGLVVATPTPQRVRFSTPRAAGPAFNDETCVDLFATDVRV